MSIISLVISIIITIHSYKISNKKILNPLTLFCSLWTFILFLSSLRLYNITKPSDEAYILISIMEICFFIGYMINLKFNLRKESKSKNESSFELNLKFFYVLCFILILFQLIDCFMVLKQLLNNVPMWQIRNWMLEPFGSSNPILDRMTFAEKTFRSIVLDPFSILIPPVAAYYFFNSNDKKNKKILLVISLIVLFCSSFAGGGGRLAFIYYIACFLFSYSIMKNNNKIKELQNKYKKIIKRLLIVGILAMVFFTIVRTGFGNLFKQVYTYFALPPTLLSIWLPSMKATSYTFGFTTFFGVHSYPFRILDTLGLDVLIPNLYNLSYQNILNAEIFKNVGYGIGNAFVTPIYYFYLDGGYITTILFSILFGYIVRCVYNNIENDMQPKNFTIYVLLMYGIFLTFMRIQTAIPSYIISYIYIYIIYRKHSSQTKVKE